MVTSLGFLNLRTIDFDVAAKQTDDWTLKWCQHRSDRGNKWRTKQNQGKTTKKQ